MLPGLPLQAAVDAAGDGAVVKGDHNKAGSMAAMMAELEELRIHPAIKPTHLDRPPSGNGEHGPDAVGAVEGAELPVAPMVALAVGDGGPDGGAIVDVLALRISDLADIAVFIAPPHLEGLVHIAVVFGIGVDLAGRLDGLDERDGLAIVWQGSTSLSTWRPELSRRMAKGACSLA